MQVPSHMLLWEGMYFFKFFCFVDRASRYSRVKKNQLDTQHTVVPPDDGPRYS